MAKFKKFISIIALAVFTLTFLVGCGLFVLNEDRYREQTAIEVGNEVVTLGEVIDYFDANGNAYIQQGYTYQQVWDMLFPVFVQQKIMLDKYKTNSTVSNNSDLAKSIGGNASYLKNETLKYVQKSVYRAFYESLDVLAMSELSEDFTFEAESADKNYPEKIVHEGDYTPADHDKNMDADALDKALEEYPANQDFKSVKYIFEESDAQVAKIVADLNKRLVKDNDEDAEVTVADYIKAQKKAISTLTKNIKNNRDLTVEEYLEKAVRDQVDAQIANEYLNSLYKNLQNKITEDIFNARLDAKIAEATTRYSQDITSFASFITNLSADDFVYYVPEQYEGQYYYVRSILLPFSDEQTELLNLAKSRFGATSQQYIQYRDSLVAGIVVKDSEGAESNVDAVKAEISNKDSFINATYKYNTDPGMQNPVHSYVVSKDPTDLGFGGTSFVKEFVDAARDMIKKGGQMTECVTDYGVHLIWNDGVVRANVLEKGESITDENRDDIIHYNGRNIYGIEGGSASWRFYQDIYLELKDVFADKQIAALYNEYIDGGKVTIHSDVITSYTETLDVVYKD